MNTPGSTFTIAVKSTSDLVALDAAIAKEKELVKTRDATDAKGGAQGLGKDGGTASKADAFLARVRGEQEALKGASETAVEATEKAGGALEGLAGRLGAAGAALGTLAGAYKLAWGDNDKLATSVSDLSSAFGALAKGTLQDFIGNGDELHWLLDSVILSLGGMTDAQRKANSVLTDYVGAAGPALDVAGKLAKAHEEEARAIRSLNEARESANRIEDAHNEAGKAGEKIEREQMLDKVRQDASLSEAARRQKLADMQGDFDEQDANAAKEKSDREASDAAEKKGIADEQAAARAKELEDLQRVAKAHNDLALAKAEVDHAKARQERGDKVATYSDEEAKYGDPKELKRKNDEALADIVAEAKLKEQRIREQNKDDLTGPYDAGKQSAAIEKAKKDADAAKEAQEKADRAAEEARAKADAEAAKLDLQNDAKREERDRKNRDANAKEEQQQQADAEKQKQQAQQEQDELNDWVDKYMDETLGNSQDATDKAKDQGKKTRQELDDSDREDDDHDERRKRRRRDREDRDEQQQQQQAQRQQQRSTSQSTYGETVNGVATPKAPELSNDNTYRETIGQAKPQTQDLERLQGELTNELIAAHGHMSADLNAKLRIIRELSTKARQDAQATQRMLGANLGHMFEPLATNSPAYTG